MRPILAEPPAESPSTKNISHFSGSLLLQSASLPGRDMFSRPVFFLVRSLALLAASLALDAVMHLSIISLAVWGCSSR